MMLTGLKVRHVRMTWHEEIGTGRLGGRSWALPVDVRLATDRLHVELGMVLLLHLLSLLMTNWEVMLQGLRMLNLQGLRILNLYGHLLRLLPSSTCCYGRWWLR